MGRFFNVIKSVLANRAARWLGIPVILAAGAASLIGQTQSTPPLVNLSADPLYARGARAKPTLTLALSVEFPTVGAQYRNGTYLPTDTYVGYFDPESCYDYEGRAATAAVNRRFTRRGDAARAAPTTGQTVGTSLHTCGGNGFSGNFMNWATGSAIDLLRLGLTGGDRIVDVDGQTVLQRAVIRTDFYNNGTYFPSKLLGQAQVTGAVPAAVGDGTANIYVANCLNQVFFGTQSTGNCVTPGNNSNLGATLRPADPFFYARVQVCDSSGATLNDSRTNLCQRYPSGNYKPVGNLQRHSDSLRVAAFGYLLDNAGNPNERYGGVLRAPMKYVGPRYFDSNFALVSGTNPVAEWNETTGVFLANPEGQSTVLSGAFSSPATSNVSGVINYLNQFGRTGAVQGQYKTYDPVGELYYESLRYLQGLTPTPAATNLMTTTMADGYPVYTTWTDPHPAVPGMTDYSCIRNNILTIGDVFTHDDRSIPGNNQRTGGVTPNDFVRNANVAGNEPDFHFWTRVVGGFESNNAVTYTDGAASAASHSTTDSGTTNFVNNFNTPNTARWGMENTNTGSTEGAYYIAGMAYWANTHDIRGTGWTSNVTAQRPGMRVTTYMIDVNENSSSSTAANRQNTQFYLAAKYGGFRDSSGTGSPFRERLADGTFARNNNNWANGAGEAKNYFLASSAQALLDSLDEIFSRLAAEANSIAGGAISTQRLTTNTGYIYQAQFDAATWSGDLIPASIAASGTEVTIGDPADLSPFATSPWRNAANARSGAAGILDDRNIASAASPRNLYVGYRTGTTPPVFDSSAFQWSSIPASVQDLLKYPGYPASAAMESTDGNARLRLEYLRGDRTQETGFLRRRGSRLGDIVNSGVVYSGAPSTAIPGASYDNTFLTDSNNRPTTLFVGANDGMLHAFNAATGAEMFGYIPSWLVSKLSALTHPAYIHQSYQDATPVVGEVNLGTTASQRWRTMLVAGSGGGGQGVFALDVTNPGSFGNANVSWEFSDRDDPAMGNVIGRPQLLKLNVGTAVSPNYRWFAVVASGVNNNSPDGNAASGAPALFFLRLDKDKATQWSEGTNPASNNYFKITFPQYSTSVANGMIGFSVRLGSAGEVSYVYAGDLQGNLWKLDMSAYVSGTAASVNTFSYFKNSAGDAAVPMYIATDNSNNLQPISMEPSLAFAANRGIIVSFGTGRFLASSDNTGPYNAQSVYALLDNNTPTLDATGGAAAIAGRGRLRAAESVTSTGVDFNPFVWGRATSNVDTGRTAAAVRSGWYFDFYNSNTVTTTPTRAGTGERQISNFAIISGKLIFGTVIPATDSCSNGNGNLYRIDLRAGDGVTSASTVGILGEPFLVQVGNSYDRTISDTTGRRSERIRYQIILQGSGGSAAPPGLNLEETFWSGRLGWREISNYQELRNTP